MDVNSQPRIPKHYWVVVVGLGRVRGVRYRVRNFKLGLRVYRYWMVVVGLVSVRASRRRPDFGRQTPQGLPVSPRWASALTRLCVCGWVGTRVDAGARVCV